MKIRDHRKTAELVDAEVVDVMEYLDTEPNKASENYTQAVQNLHTLQESKQIEVQMAQEKQTLISEFTRGLAGGVVAGAGIGLIWYSEATGEVMLNQSEKSFIKDLKNLKFKPGH